MTPPARARLLIVEDDQAVLNQLEWGLRDYFEVATAQDPKQALDIASRTSHDLVALDLALTENDPESGFAVLDRLLGLDPSLKVILITGQEDRGLGIRALERGAFDFFTKPLDIDELRVLLGRALSIRNLEKENRILKQQLGGMDVVEWLVGRSEPMLRVNRVVRKVAPASVPVLITGEKGTGKEVVAREIHRQSGRPNHHFFYVNCGALPPKELEVALFGQAADVRSGQSGLGRLVRAQEGTLFLDEVEALAPHLQVRLLHFLEERRIMRSRGGEEILLNTRIVTGTGADLEEFVQKQRFREDLFYRLAVVTIRLPALRDRREDIVLAAEDMLNRYAKEFHRGILRFHRKALWAMQRYAWPGNLREMEHRIQRAVVLSSGRLIRAEDLQLEDEATPQRALREAREDAERLVIRQSLRRNCGNIAQASRELKISRPTLHDLLRKFSIRAADFKDGIGPASKKEEGP